MEPIVENTGMIHPTTVSHMVDAWNKSKDLIEKAHEMLHEADAVLRQEFSGPYRHPHVNFDNLRYQEVTSTIDTLKMDVWASILERTNVRKLMTEQKQREVDSQLKNPAQLPDVTELNVLAFLENMYNSLPSVAQSMMQEVYEWLRPRGGSRYEYVTNMKSEAAGVGRKVIKGWSVEHGYSSTKPWKIRYSSQDRFTSLDNVFSLLDGKGVAKTHYGPIYDAVAACDPNGVCETEYFRLKCYRNGNLHLEFKRIDLLDKFNLACGGAIIRNGTAHS